jgi:hypothetical protein
VIERTPQIVIDPVILADLVDETLMRLWSRPSCSSAALPGPRRYEFGKNMVAESQRLLLMQHSLQQAQSPIPKVVAFQTSAITRQLDETVEGVF